MRPIYGDGREERTLEPSERWFPEADTLHRHSSQPSSRVLNEHTRDSVSNSFNASEQDLVASHETWTSVYLSEQLTNSHFMHCLTSNQLRATDVEEFYCEIFFHQLA